jgi:hypothetical protein
MAPSPAPQPRGAGSAWARVFFLRTFAGNNRGACRVAQMDASSLSPPSPRRGLDATCPASEPTTRAGLFCEEATPMATILQRRVAQLHAGSSPRAGDAKHQRQKLVCERGRIVSYPIVRHQEPTCQAHIQPGLRVADRGVCCLNAKCLHELQQRVAKRQAGWVPLRNSNGSPQS